MSKSAAKDWKDDATNDDDVKKDGAATFVWLLEGFEGRSSQQERLKARHLQWMMKVDNCDALWEEVIELAIVGDNVRDKYDGWKWNMDTEYG